MSPRKYDMGKRAAAVEETRRRIVDATMALHGEQGIAATSWDDIAARAGVGVGTVYRHFPSLDELVPACGALIAERLALPDAAAARELFGAASGADRPSRLVDAVYSIYERGAPVVERMASEGDVHPAVAGAHDDVERSIDALVREALRPLRASADQKRTVRALLDVGTWRAFERSGLSHARAREAASRLVEAALAA